MVYWIGAAGAVMFVLVFLLDGWTRSEYSSLRHPVSALALGPRGWVQTANFIVSGAAVTIGAIGILTSGSGLLLGVVLAVFGVALVLSGVFPMDPMLGYPEGAPASIPESHSTAHSLHDAAGAAVFLALPAAAAISVFTLSDLLWQILSGAAAVYLFFAFTAFNKAWEGISPRIGMVQRCFIIPGWLWLAGLFMAWGSEWV